MKTFGMRPSLAMKKPKYAVWDDKGDVRLLALKECLVTSRGYMVTGKDLLSSGVFNRAPLEEQKSTPQPPPILFTTDKHDAKRFALDLIESQRQQKIRELDKYVANRVTRIQNVR